MSTTIGKPLDLAGHDLHRVVAGIAPGALHRDEGTHVLVNADIARDMRAFKLRASVCYRKQGRNRYPHSSDWQTRHEWLREQGERHGFDVIHVYARAGRQRINGFVIDATDFVGVLRVRDEARFQEALARGIGRVGRAWGMGMLVVN